ncbi:M23 family metallopeptidase [Hymenobacter nivis]|uniref:M23ase beta-sheet core domain-containing protein n=1 Tax=Hymenobacter nivis TaxID=1850093 RepID=A0A502GQ83_9BACT|nr:M23 family metallopeptidase [Hymenobacter nivis]TPG63682.1 hypothetical protein EAH73_16655 [Hymenobacter nivis]
MLFWTNFLVARPRRRLFPHPLFLLLWLPALLLGACGKQQTLQALFQARTPHEAYAHRLRQAGLDRGPAGGAWLAAADRALRDSLVVALPFTETGYFLPGQPAAAGYRFAVQAGEQVRVRLELAPGSTARVFVDAFEVGPGGAPAPLASADTAALDFRYRADASGQHLLRVQPELLAAGRYTLRLTREPSLGTFPVRGRADAAIGSFWGVDRDGGARRHEGIDIFAPRGTPAIAAAAGTVTRLGNTRLGGNVVWLNADGTDEHLYYAHLDRQLVQPGQRVRPGDTLGLVGNTGNARTTAPHLHFGIYRAGQGAVDPLPFVRRASPAAAPPTGPDLRGTWVRLRAAGPLESKAGSKASGPRLAAQTPLLVLGQQGALLRVRTAAGRPGYVAAAAVRPAEAAPLRRLLLPAATEVAAEPAEAPVAAWPARTPVAVLGEADGFSLLRGPAGALGWARI